MADVSSRGRVWVNSPWTCAFTTPNAWGGINVEIRWSAVSTAPASGRYAPSETRKNRKGKRENVK